MATERNAQGVDVIGTLATLAALVRLHEGNRDEQVNKLLADSIVARDAVAELARAAKVYFDGYCVDEADDHFDPGEPRGEETGCTREQHRAAKDLRAALLPFQSEAR